MPSTVECPLCKRTLSFPEDAAGQSVRCPGCYGVFTLDAPKSVTTHPSPAPAKKPESADAKPRPRVLDDDDDYSDHRRYREDGDDFDEYDYRPDRRMHFRPHRGGMIQTLGILSIVLSCVPFVGGVLGLLGVIMGQADLAEIDAGNMDPMGRSITQGGRTCAIFGLGLSVLSLLFFLARMGMFR